MANQQLAAEALLWLRDTADTVIEGHDCSPDSGQQEDLKGSAPFSFRYGELTSSEFLERCDVQHDSKQLDQNRTAHTVRYLHPQSKLDNRRYGSCRDPEKDSSALPSLLGPEAGRSTS